MEVQPYLFFEGRCREALDFYKKTLGAQEVMAMKFSESPDQHSPKDLPIDAIMHAAFKIGSSTILASDGHCTGSAAFSGFSLSISPATDAEAKRMFDDLSRGGEVRMPMQKTFFASSFGMCADKFGVGWIVVVESGPK